MIKVMNVRRRDRVRIKLADGMVVLLWASLVRSSAVQESSSRPPSTRISEPETAVAQALLEHIGDDNPLRPVAT
jgi:hypothetical protein